MRKEDRKRLSARLPKHARVEEEIERMLNVRVPNVHRLRQAIYNDEVEKHLSTPRKASSDTATRILVGDYMLSCLNEVVHHLTLARLANLEFRHAKDNEEQISDSIVNISPRRNAIGVFRDICRFALSITSRSENTTNRFRRPKSPLRSIEMADLFADMYSDSVVVSLCSAMDCLAAVIVGIAPLRRNIKTASFIAVSQDLERLYARRGSAASKKKHQVCSCVEQSEQLTKACRMSEHLEWMWKYRNYLVHRGRRIQASWPTSDTQFRNRLPKYPQLSEVEHALFSERGDPERILFAERIREGWLDEDPGELLSKMTDEVVHKVNQIAAVLLRIWIRRQGDTGFASPPREQWDLQTKVPKWSSLVEIAPTRDQIIVHPSVGKRWRAACVEDNRCAIWKNGKMATFVPKAKAASHE